MKRIRKCPKCGSEAIIVIQAKSGGNKTHRGFFLGLTVLSLAQPEAHVCQGCGYVEEYFTQDQLEKLEKA